MKCTYCGCPKDGTHDLKGYLYCVGHYETIRDKKVTGKSLGHQSKFDIGEVDRHEYDTVDEFNWETRRTRLGNEELN